MNIKLVQISKFGRQKWNKLSYTNTEPKWLEEAKMNFFWQL